MTDHCTVVRHNDKLEATIAKCQEWKQRYKSVRLSDTGMWSNQNLSFARAVRDMLLQAEAVLKGALMRNESRGAHYKPEYKDRDDANFLKTTIATYNPATDSADITYAPVDTSLVEPRARTYGKTAAGGGGGATPATQAKPAMTGGSAGTGQQQPVAAGV